MAGWRKALARIRGRRRGVGAVTTRKCMEGENAHKPGPCPGPEASKGTASTREGRDDSENTNRPARSDTEGERATESDAERDWKENGVRSKAFKAWFGDWENHESVKKGLVSKVVAWVKGKITPMPNQVTDPSASRVIDREGKPTVVFHGTQADFEEFDPKKTNPNALLGPGFYFTEDPHTAEEYAKSGNVLRGGNDKQGSKPKLFRVFLNIRKPFDADWHLSNLVKNPGVAKFSYEFVSAAMGGNKKATEALRKLGYDGITTLGKTSDGKGQHRVWIAFDPDQIKSTENRGTFDNRERNINKSLWTSDLTRKSSDRRSVYVRSRQLKLTRRCMVGRNRGKTGPCPEDSHSPPSANRPTKRPDAEPPAPERTAPYPAPRQSKLEATRDTRGQVQPPPREERQHEQQRREEALPSSSADRSTLHQSLEKSRMRRADRLRDSGINDSYLLTLEDGTRGVFKPRSGEEEQPRDGVPMRTGYVREVAASRLADILGMSDLVPATTFRHQSGHGLGSMQVFVEYTDKPVGSDEPFDGGKDAARAAAFDYLLGHLDRHPGNWLLKSSKLVLIDNGLSLPTHYSENDFFNLEFWKNASEKELPLPDISAWSDKWDAVEKELRDCGVEDDAIRLTKQRFGVLVSGQHERIADLPSLLDSGQTLGQMAAYYNRNARRKRADDLMEKAALELEK